MKIETRVKKVAVSTTGPEGCQGLLLSGKEQVGKRILGEAHQLKHEENKGGGGGQSEGFDTRGRLKT